MAPRLSIAPPLVFGCYSKRLQETRNSDVSRNPKAMEDNSHECEGNIMLMMKLRKKILTFRDIIDLPPCDSSGSIHELMMGTVADLHELYPNVIPSNLSSEMKETSIHQGLAHLYNALDSIGDSWAKNHRWINNFGKNKEDNLENANLKQLGGKVLVKLDRMIKVAREMFDVMDEDDENKEERKQGFIFGDILSESYSNNKITCPSPDTPTSVPPELNLAMNLNESADVSYSQPLLLPLRLHAVGILNPIDIRCLSFNHFTHASAPVSSPTKDLRKIVDEPMQEIQKVAEELPAKVTYGGLKESKATDNSPKNPNFSSNVTPEAREQVAPPPPPPPSLPNQQLMDPSPPSTPPLNVTAAPPPPPIPPSNGTVPSQSPPVPMTKGGAAPPPPPPLGVAKALRAKKANTKLKRSTQMGNLYRILKGKVEGSSLKDKQSRGRKSQIGGSSGGKQGMADALAEMTKRSAYFQQIEEDVQKHGKSVMQMKAEIISFQTKDMVELLKFHRYVEQHLEELTDETQVLARFEGFPTKKLEALRTAAALYSKLERINTNLQNWKVVPPLAQLLDKFESYFSKIKGEVDALERSKDEDSKRFQSNNIHFDFSILLRIKETVVDVSSSCMELALRERREAYEAANVESGSKTQNRNMASTKMLWRAFQLAYRVYGFAGGQDDRADRLSKELAQEIETDPQQK